MLKGTHNGTGLSSESPRMNESLSLFPPLHYPCHWIFWLHWFVGNQDKTSMILCAPSTSRSSEQNTQKNRSCSENKQKIYLFYSQNNKTVWLSKMEDTFMDKFIRCTKVCELFFLIFVLFGCWLAEQANSNPMDITLYLLWTQLNPLTAKRQSWLNQENF